MLAADPGTKVSVSLSTGVSGQVGLLAVQVVDPGSQRVMIPRTTVGITEYPAGSAVYGVQLVAPLAPGLYMIIWDIAGSGAITPSNSWTEQLTVNFEELEVGELGLGWWPLWVVDPGADVSTGLAGSNPIPTAADVRAASNLTWTDYGAGLGNDAGPAGLQEIVDRAESAFWNITGQTLDSINPKYAPQVRRVIQGMAEQLAMAGSEDVLSTQSDWDLISSFSAGPYSEQHRSPADMLAGRMLFPVPWISQELWGLLTPERYAFWMSFFTGFNQPAWTTSEVFWEEGAAWGRAFGPGAGYFWGA